VDQRLPVSGRLEHPDPLAVEHAPEPAALGGGRLEGIVRPEAREDAGEAELADAPSDRRAEVVHVGRKERA
jgi:hypothetical protein